MENIIKSFIGICLTEVQSANNNQFDYRHSSHSICLLLFEPSWMTWEKMTMLKASIIERGALFWSRSMPSILHTSFVLICLSNLQTIILVLGSFVNYRLMIIERRIHIMNRISYTIHTGILITAQFYHWICWRFECGTFAPFGGVVAIVEHGCVCGRVSLPFHLMSDECNQ